MRDKCWSCSTPAGHVRKVDDSAVALMGPMRLDETSSLGDAGAVTLPD